MSGIVCAIRGGPESRPTIQKAIELAKESGLPLYFLYVVNLDFLSYTSSSRVQVITHEMEQMGEFILLMAQEEAREQGVEAQGVVRQGRLREALIEFAREIDADYLVLGCPKTTRRGKDNAFTPEMLADFARGFEEASGAKVVFSEEGCDGA
jgi:nucleotide-binding universal stress UspA family protein